MLEKILVHPEILVEIDKDLKKYSTMRLDSRGDLITVKSLEALKFTVKTLTENNIKYRKGEIACALSHYKLWHKLLNDDNNNYYVILEDDVTIVENFVEKIDKCIDIFNKNNIEYALIGGYYITDKCSNNDDINFTLLLAIIIIY